jgi:hypothetical protein
VALLRCRDRLALALDAVAEPRRSELARAIAELESFNDARLKQTLTEKIRRQNEALREVMGQTLNSAMAKAPRVVREWIAHRMDQ